MRRLAAHFSGAIALLLAGGCLHDQPTAIVPEPDDNAFIRFDQLLVQARKDQLMADMVYDGKIYMDPSMTPALIAVPMVYRARQCGLDTSASRPDLLQFLESKGFNSADIAEYMNFFDAGLQALQLRSGPSPCAGQEATDFKAMFDEFNRLILPGAEPPRFPETLLADAADARPPVTPPATAVWADQQTTGPAAAPSVFPWSPAPGGAAVTPGTSEVLPWRQTSPTSGYSQQTSTSAYSSRYATPEPYVPPTRADVRYAVQSDIGNTTGVPITEDQQRRSSIEATGVDLTPWLR